MNPALRDLTVAGILKALPVLVPANVPVDTAIEVHREALTRDVRLARFALRVIVLARAPTLSAIAHSIAWFQLN